MSCPKPSPFRRHDSSIGTVLVVAVGMVCLGSHTPSFGQAPPQYATPRVFFTSPSGDPLPGIEPYGIAVGDMDNDGDRDLAVAFAASENGAGRPDVIKVYRNNGNWTTGTGFDPPATYVVGTPGTNDYPLEIQFAHISVDGNPPDAFLDLVVTLSGVGSVQVLLNRGDGTFDDSNSTHVYIYQVLAPGGVILVHPTGLVVTDFDHNGRNDICVAGFVVAPTLAPALGVMWGETNGAFTAQMYRVSPNFFDGEGYDLVAFRQVATQAPIYGSNPTHLAMSDDVAATLHVFKYQAGRQFQITNVPGIRSQGLAAADLDFDGNFYDLASTAAGGSTFSWYQWGSTGFTLKDPYTAHQRTGGVDAGRMNRGDSLPDVVCANFRDTATQSISVFVNSGNPSLGQLFTRYDFGVGVAHAFTGQVLLADLNGDGWLDVITSNAGSSAGDDDEESVSVLINTG